MVAPGKMLLVLDVNGLLLDTYFQSETRPDRPHDAQVNRFYVYKRPFCEEFIQFCFKNFIVGVWSSAREHNVSSLVEFMFKGAKEKLAFIWHQQHCTDAGIKHPENKFKPVFLKELSRLWKKSEPDLPWEDGEYGPSNTLLIDDSAYKAINNPDHTAIFPKTYRATDIEDDFLAFQCIRFGLHWQYLRFPGGELRTYLEGLLKSKDVQSYLKRNPIGQPSIGLSDPLGLRSLIEAMSKAKQTPAHVIGTSAPAIPISIPSSGGRMSDFIPSSRRMPDSIPYNDWIPVLPNSIPSFNQYVPAIAKYIPHQRIMASNFHMSPRMGRDSQTGGFENGENTWRRSDHINEGYSDYSHAGFAYDTIRNSVGPSLPMSSEPGYGLIRSSRNADHPYQVQSGGRLQETANIFNGGQTYDDSLWRNQCVDPRRPFRGWSEEIGDLSKPSSQVDYHQGDYKRRRRRSVGTWNLDDHQREECARKKHQHRAWDDGARNRVDHQREEGTWKRHRDGTWDEEATTTHQGERARRWRDGMYMDENSAISYNRRRDWSMAREYEIMHSSQGRAQPDYGRIKSREYRDLQNLSDRDGSLRERDVSDLWQKSYQNHDGNNPKWNKNKKYRA